MTNENLYRPFRKEFDPKQVQYVLQAGYFDGYGSNPEALAYNKRSSIDKIGKWLFTNHYKYFVYNNDQSRRVIFLEQGSDIHYWRESLHAVGVVHQLCRAPHEEAPLCHWQGVDEHEQDAKPTRTAHE
jgi:hypothetical protein